MTAQRFPAWQLRRTDCYASKMSFATFLGPQLCLFEASQKLSGHDEEDKLHAVVFFHVQGPKTQVFLLFFIKEGKKQRKKGRKEERKNDRKIFMPPGGHGGNGVMTRAGTRTRRGQAAPEQGLQGGPHEVCMGQARSTGQQDGCQESQERSWPQHLQLVR